MQWGPNLEPVQHSPITCFPCMSCSLK
jgi:hypothetical protein